MRHLFIAFASGVVFALGLGISGMTDPQRILGFLDIAGHWDPSLAFVMLGAIAVHLGPAQWALRAKRPLLADRFEVPRRTAVDTELLLGSVLFGVGWGAIGYCPGPAIVDLVAAPPGLCVFAIAMLVGTALFRYGRRLLPSVAPTGLPGNK
jgi:uncharacterized membrane protein YedE/YeeE